VHDELCGALPDVPGETAKEAVQDPVVCPTERIPDETFAGRARARMSAQQHPPRDSNFASVSTDVAAVIGGAPKVSKEFLEQCAASDREVTHPSQDEPAQPKTAIPSRISSLRESQFGEPQEPFAQRQNALFGGDGESHREGLPEAQEAIGFATRESAPSTDWSIAVARGAVESLTRVFPPSGVPSLPALLPGRVAMPPAAGVTAPLQRPPIGAEDTPPPYDDLHDFAAKLQRILREDARRHGISV
jgi:hypothetical protein